MPGAGIEIDLKGDALVILRQLKSEFTALNSKVDVLEENTKSSFKGIGDSLKQISLVSITQGFENFNNTLRSVNEPGLTFENQLADLSAITGIVGDDLQLLGDKARENAMTFGGDASNSVEVYKLLLSQLSPELAQYPDLLGGMGDSVSVLSKTMKGDTAGAVEVLTTAMNQYSVSMDDPIKAQEELNRMMNAMAAGAQAGSAELPALKDAIENVGGDAKSSGLEFEELVSAIEALDKAGKKGSEGGTALRNVLASLNQGRFLPKDVQEELGAAGVNMDLLSDKSLSFTDRLRALNPVANDAALLSKLFGKENKLAAEALLNSVDAQDAMTQAITGTNTANEQANIIMNTRSEGLSRWSAWFDDIKIGLSEATGAFLPFMEVSFSALQGLSTIVPAIRSITMAVNFLRVAENRLLIVTKLRNMWQNITNLSAMKTIALQKVQSMWTGIVTAAQWAWNFAMTMNPIGLIIVGIGALIAGIAWLTDGFKGFGDFFISFWEGLKSWFSNLVDFWNTYLNPFNWLLNLIDYVFPGAKDAIVGWFEDLFQWIWDVFFQPFIDAWDWFVGLFDWFDDEELEGSVEHTVKKEEEKDNSALKALSGYSRDHERLDVNRNRGKYGGAVPFGGISSSSKSEGSKSAGFASAEKKEINTTVENLVKQLVINVPNVEMSVAKIREMISEALVGAVRDFETTID